MQNLTTVHATVKGNATTEINDALRTLRAAEHRLERETFIFDWEERLEMAAELADLLAELPEELADETGRVILKLDDESETFADWPTRCEAAARLRRVVASLADESNTGGDFAPETPADPDDEDDDWLDIFDRPEAGDWNLGEQFAPPDDGRQDADWSDLAEPEIDFPGQRVQFVHDYASTAEMEREKGGIF